ncbi:MAG: proteasome assembly chaperone family protein [Euryarchaeota archaeon]|nr:proteasome assembly chaperone family protein [Euryarchaeota archaeon]
MDIIEIEEMNIRGAYVIDGFPSVGLVGSIVANYLANALELRQIAVVDSEYFPTVSTIRRGIPHSPVRVYGGEFDEGERIVVFVSEFQPPPNMLKVLGMTIMDWVEDHKCHLVISPEGISNKQSGRLPQDEHYEVLGVGSTPEAREMLKDREVSIFEGGVIVGLSGVLLNEGVNRAFDVITLLADASPDIPDARAAAAEAAVINRMILHDRLDLQPLLEEAEKIEEGLKDIYDKAGREQEIRNTSALPTMYG